MANPIITIHNSPKIQAEMLAQIISNVLLKETYSNDLITLVLSGGSSPRILITELAKENLPWTNIQITTTDERCVALESKHSNMGQITRLFAQEGQGITPIHLWDEERQEVTNNALPLPPCVTVLGMGTDGHIASLFPNQKWNDGNEPILKATAPVEPKNRISLSMSTLIASKNLFLLVNGAEKWSLYQRIMAGQAIDTPLAQLIKQAGDKLLVHVVSET